MSLPIPSISPFQTPGMSRRPGSGAAESKPSVQFTGCFDTWSRYQGEEFQHTTSLFRLERQMLALPDLLKKHFPDGCTIYDYACSDGSESYSIAITLNEAGMDAARYPIIGRDISPAIIQVAQSGILNMMPCEFDRIANIFPGSNAKGYFSPGQTDPLSRPMALYPGDLEEMHAKYEDAAKPYTVSPRLRQQVRFEQGDLGKDRFEQPALILFNNQLYHLGKRRQRQLLDNLYAHCQPGSIVLAHGADPAMMRSVGFDRLADHQSDPNYPVFIKRDGPAQCGNAAQKSETRSFFGWLLGKRKSA